MTEGVYTRHEKRCATHRDGRCNCLPRQEARAEKNGVVRNKTFRSKTKAEAISWRTDVLRAIDAGIISNSQTAARTLKDISAQWLQDAQAGVVRNSKGQIYKPSVLRTYERALRLRVNPKLGHLKPQDLRRSHCQQLVDELLHEGKSPSTVRNTLDPLRAIYRYLHRREVVRINPTLDLEIPQDAENQIRIASPEEAAALIAAIPRAGDRAVYATAFYAGLRRGEVRALKWENIDLATGNIKVEKTWDDKEGEVEPKSKAGKRTVPISRALRDHLAHHKADCEWATGYAFGRGPDITFSPTNLRKRVHRAWADNNLEQIKLHDCRHTFASVCIAAGVSIKAIQVYMGHSSITQTIDRYGHLLPGSDQESVGRIDAYLLRATDGESSDDSPMMRTPEERFTASQGDSTATLKGCE